MIVGDFEFYSGMFGVEEAVCFAVVSDYLPFCVFVILCVCLYLCYYYYW